jgi:PAS domain S-box-containing protein
VIDLSRYAFEALRKDEEFILYRGRSEDDAVQVLVASPAVEYPAPESLKLLEHAYSLREELDARWAARPIAMARHWDRTVLVMEDPGGVPLDRWLGQPLNVAFSLRLAISLSSAIGHLHQRGIIHKDIKPAHVLVNSDTGQCWLRGFGIASRLPRERQSPESPEFIAGTLAYMAPEQTGRMNRSVDSRSDLYALGVTLYEMLTGSLPFTASDPMEWVHCHVARQPIPPGERSTNVPASVSAIIMKLLAKTAEERYQTAAGAESDLRRCFAQWETQRHIDEFPLGEHDTPDRILIPEKLYGRAREIDTLLASFDRVVASGRPELVLVSGYSGIGKSSIVNELHKVLVPRRGLFASGKFDQYKRDIPYSTLGQALQSLIRPLLGKSEAELRNWCEALREALDPNGLLIVDLVPELKLIIGEQPPVPELPPQDAQRRFQLVFRRFIGVFARPEHPLAFFVDDLQWLDAATLDLLEDLLTSDFADRRSSQPAEAKLGRTGRPDVQHMMLIGAYRDNEVNSAHPLMRKLEAIRKAGARVQEIILAPLAGEELGRLIADSLHCEPERVTPLAQLVHDKTAGNPFFAIQFLSALAEEALLTFDHSAAKWSWDLNRIHGKGYTDNVVELMAGKLSRLPMETQQALQQLACLGNLASIATLSIVLGASEAEVQVTLWEAVRQELIVRVADDAYRFVHDRVQEAAYSLIPEELRAESHLRIGRLLVAHTPPEKREETIFEIVNQFNRGAALITSRDEWEQLTELNLRAGERAKASTAYASALKYFIAGAALLADDCWERRHELAFALELHRAECEFLTGEPAAAAERLSVLSSRAANTVEQATVACLRVELYTTLDQSDRAVGVGLEYLRHLGIEWSPHPTQEEARREYERIWSQLASRAIEELIELPLMSDPASLATLDVLTKVLPPALFTDANLLSLAICRAVNLSLEHGNSDGSCFAYVWLGVIAGPHFDNYKAGFRFGRLGYQLVEKRGLRRFQARTYVSFGNLVMPWTKHIKTGRDLLRREFEAANKIGDLTFAAYSRLDLNTNLLAAGDPLVEVQQETEHGLEFAHKMRFGLVIDRITAQLGLIRTLRGLTHKFGSFDDGQFDELRFESHLSGNPALALPECWYWIRKLQARFFAGDCAAAVDASLKAQRLLWTSPSCFETAEYHFYGALSRAASCCDSGAADQRQQHFEALSAHHRQLEIWAENCPDNFENRAALVGAEIARIEGRALDATDLYEQAIRSAQANGFAHNEALAHELAARFYAARGFERIAHAYMRNAWHCYLRWGATGKIRQLEELYPHLREEAPVPAPVSTIGATVEHLDLATVIKVSHAISGEIVLDKLINKLMRIAIEQAGAERGLLILARGNGQRIEAEASSDRGQVTVHFCRSLVTPSELPESLLRYVIRTEESVTLHDASTENLFSEDEYIRRKRPRSVFCLPLIKQRKLVGVLYLENNLAPGVFTPNRLAILELIASQAAISLEQARLYDQLRRTNEDLQTEISERRRAEEALKKSEQRLQDIVDNTTAMVFVKDLDLHYVLANREHERRFHVQRDQICGKTDYDFLPHDIADKVRANDRQVIEAGRPTQFEVAIPMAESVRHYVVVKFLLRDGTGKPYAICGISTDITESKRAQEMQAALARERETFALQRAVELGRANEALRGCLDALASVRELDDFLGQVMATMTRQLGAVSSTLRVRNFEQNTLPLEFVYQDGRVMSPAEAKYPEGWQSVSVEQFDPDFLCHSASKRTKDEQRVAKFLDQPAAIIRVLDPHSPMPDDQRSYLRELGVKTVLIIPLTSGGQVNGRLTFRFTEERDFHPEELEIARALATQASLAIQLTRLAQTARQSAVLEERNQLAGEIHDSLAQFFTGITMQLGAAREVFKAGSGNVLSYLERASDLAQFGLSEARRSAFSLQPTILWESGLIEALQKLVERSNIPGRLRCNFHSTDLPEESLPPSVQQDLLRIAQEAISNAVRHAKPTVISVNLRCEPPNLVLEVTDNGSGIADAQAASREGFGFSNMRARAENIGAQLNVRTASGRGTTIVVHVPVNF